MQGTLKTNEAVELGMKRGFSLRGDKSLVKYVNKGNDKAFRIAVYWKGLRGSEYFTPVVSCCLMERTGSCLRSVGLGFTRVLDNMYLRKIRRMNDLWKMLDKVDETALFAKYALIKDTDVLYSKENFINNPVLSVIDGKVCETPIVM